MTKNVSDLTSDQLLQVVRQRAAFVPVSTAATSPDWGYQDPRWEQYSALSEKAASERDLVLVLKNVYCSPASPRGDDEVAPFIHAALQDLLTRNSVGSFPWACENGVVIEMCHVPTEHEVHARVMQQMGESDTPTSAPTL